MYIDNNNNFDFYNLNNKKIEIDKFNFSFF